MSNEPHLTEPNGQGPSLPVWDEEQVNQLLTELGRLRADILECEERFGDAARGLPDRHGPSAANLLHYLGLRRHDVRALQEKLAALGLSSLGRSESSVLASIDAVRKILHQLARRPWSDEVPSHVPAGVAAGKELLAARTEALLGPKPHGRTVRIMVTMPREAADDYGLVRDLLASGMNCLRINCAHDEPEVWQRMIDHLRRAEAEVGRKGLVEMDLAGPKLRTGPLPLGPRVVKWRSARDKFGRVIAPARVWLTPAEKPAEPPAPAAACVPVSQEWLAGLRGGDRIKFTDARGASRSLRVVEEVGESRWAEGKKTVYLASGIKLRRTGENDRDRPVHPRKARVGELPPKPVTLALRKGDTLILTRDAAPGKLPTRGADGRLLSPGVIGCTLPEVFADVRPGEAVWLDDGKIGGVIRGVEEERLIVEITQVPAKGAKLGADKGINLPDTDLHLPGLTKKDFDDLAFLVGHADLVGLSFVRTAEDVSLLQEELRKRNGEHLGIVLKVETRTAFEQLPSLLLAAMRGRAAGVMIARGDLAVECGYERLAEVQEEMLWVCEAAHVPVIWATQVLENLAKEGFPSRAEITDAAMGERAECVMLNKGAHVVEAVRVLDHILRRMEAHQNKKRSMLRQLKVADAFSEDS
jgi:pyruvate kinase